MSDESPLVLAAPFPDGEASCALEESDDPADQLALDAYGTNDRDEACRLAREALQLDPEHVDALVIAATRRDVSREERIAGIRHAVEVAARRMNAEPRTPNADVWELRHARAYMTSAFALAEALRRAGLHDEALPIYYRLLDLDEGDRLAVRLTLLGHLLEHHDLARAGLLFARFEQDTAATIQWANVLWLFLSARFDEARERRIDALTENRWVEEYLTGRLKQDKKLRPALYMRHSPGEALFVLSYIGGAWKAHPDAIAWLKKGAKPPKARKK